MFGSVPFQFQFSSRDIEFVRVIGRIQTRTKHIFDLVINVLRPSVVDDIISFFAKKPPHCLRFLRLLYFFILVRLCSPRNSSFSNLICRNVGGLVLHG